MIETFAQDFRYAVRTLRRSPGRVHDCGRCDYRVRIGPTTAIFTLPNAVLFRAPGGVVEPDRLVSIYMSDYSGRAYGASSYSDHQAFTAATDAFEVVMAFSPTR